MCPSKTIHRGFLNRAKGDKKPRTTEATVPTETDRSAEVAPKESKVSAEVETLQRKEVRWVRGGESLEDHLAGAWKGAKELGVPKIPS